MPIKKRGGGLVKPTTPNSTPKLYVKKKVKLKKPKQETPKPVVEKKHPVINVKKRKPPESRYVYLDGSTLVVRTPAECTKWPTDFRMRIIANYTPPRTMKSIADYEKNNADSKSTVYRIGVSKLMVRQPYEEVGYGRLVVLRTEVVNLTSKKTLFLNHDDPAMRVLMVYSFIHEETFGGVPKLVIADEN